ncbi:hypothetical protein LOY55_09770 [Pseudomonas sp. B21-040]|uniref:hypothetical protein n=1 Tax=Pseudomonas sp. B21-040 TaxID=2895486 RepID=UPI00215F7876|nr:hypothetical protein [Pseudomonas sp. B21-040]UVL42367.1 hypothetical protein LOY55_09770 [Pseudomonas sp. B21-040]
MLDQDEKENIRRDNTTSENSELTQDEWKLLTWYREVPEADQGYILHIAQTLAAL